MMKNQELKEVFSVDQSFLLNRDGLEIPCILTLPEGGEPRRIILSVHGFGGNSQNKIQVSIAEEMAFFGSATLRFDFPCHGENPLDSDDFSLANCCRTLMAAACHLRESFPQVEDLCIFATGFGAYVTLVCLEDLLELPGRVKLVIQTPSVRMDKSLLIQSKTSAPTLKAMEATIIDAVRPFAVGYCFYEELRQNIVMNSYPIPMLILMGEADHVIQEEDIRQFRRLNEQSKLVYIPGATHRFLEEGAWDMVLDLTRDWFEFEQVLVSDWE